MRSTDSASAISIAIVDSGRRIGDSAPIPNNCSRRGGASRSGIGARIIALFYRYKRYETDEATVVLHLPTVTHQPFVRFVTDEERERRELDLDDLILLRAAADRGEIDRWTGSRVLQLTEDDAAEKLKSLRERQYLDPRGRGKGTAYRLARRLSDLLRGTPATDDDVVLDREAVRLRLLKVLAERGSLTNAEIRRLSGFGRQEVIRLMRELRNSGDVVLQGKGRAAVYRPAPAAARRRRPTDLYLRSDDQKGE
jgi:hypothetical protein